MKTRQTASTRQVVRIAVAAGVALGSAPALADSIFLQIPNIPGESTDSKHKDWIEVLSYSHSLSSNNCPQVAIAKLVDSATPGLSEAINNAAGKGITSATLAVAKTTYEGKPVDYLSIVMSQVVVQNSSISVNSGGDSGAYETVGLQAASMTITYQQFDAKGGPGKVISGNPVMCPNGVKPK
jgi:type VI secretion system secreted protein Hcp